MYVSVLALDGVFDLGLSALLDTFGTANDLADDEPLFEVAVTGLRRRVKTARGLAVPVTPIDPSRRPDRIVVSALGAKTPAVLSDVLVRPDVTEAGRWLRDQADHGVSVAAACTGTFVLAEAGLLDDHRATTSWWLGPWFRQRYPAVGLDETRMVVPSGRFVTAGAALAHIDLALWIVRQTSPELAAMTARYLLIDARPSQATFAIPDHLQHADPLVERFESWARDHLTTAFSLDDAAHGIGTSPRTLERRVQRVLGRSPVAFVQDLRVERAIHLLRTTDESVDAIAEHVGYRAAVTLRNLLRRKTGKGVRELRTGSV